MKKTASGELACVISGPTVSRGPRFDDPFGGARPRKGTNRATFGGRAQGQLGDRRSHQARAKLRTWARLLAYRRSDAAVSGRWTWSSVLLRFGRLQQGDQAGVLLPHLKPKVDDETRRGHRRGQVRRTRTSPQCIQKEIPSSPRGSRCCHRSTLRCSGSFDQLLDSAAGFVDGAEDLVVGQVELGRRLVGVVVPRAVVRLISGVEEFLPACSGRPRPTSVRFWQLPEHLLQPGHVQGATRVSQPRIGDP